MFLIFWILAYIASKVMKVEYHYISKILFFLAQQLEAELEAIDVEIEDEL